MLAFRRFSRVETPTSECRISWTRCWLCASWGVLRCSGVVGAASWIGDARAPSFAGSDALLKSGLKGSAMSTGASVGGAFIAGSDTMVVTYMPAVILGDAQPIRRRHGTDCSNVIVSAARFLSHPTHRTQPVTQASPASCRHSLDILRDYTPFSLVLGSIALRVNAQHVQQLTRRGRNMPPECPLCELSSLPVVLSYISLIDPPRQSLVITILSLIIPIFISCVPMDVAALWSCARF